MTNLDKEVSRMLLAGCKLVTLKQYEADIATMGFRLDKRMNAACIARDMETGDSYPALTGYAIQKETGAGFANIKANRDCEGWEEFMAYRKNHFAVVKEQLFTV